MIYRTCSVYDVLYDAPVEGGTDVAGAAWHVEMLVAGGVHPLIGRHCQAGHLAEE